MALALDAIGGLCFAAVEHLPVGVGCYWALTTATTVGYGDVAPRTTAGHVIAVLAMLTVIPLFAATFSLLTSGLTSQHVSTHLRARHAEHTEHLDRLGESLVDLHQKLDDLTRR